MRAQVAQALHGWGRAMRVAAAGKRGADTVLVVGVIAVLLAAALGVSGFIQAQAAAGRSIVNLIHNIIEKAIMASRKNGVTEEGCP